MYKTIYRFRVRVEDKSYSFPLHLCIYQGKEPRFNELLDKIRLAVSTKEVDLNEYNIALDTESTYRSSHIILHDDQSLVDALKSSAERHYFELVLLRKRARTLSPPGYAFRRASPVEPIGRHHHWSSDDVPVIKPTVLRWSPVSTSEMQTQPRLSVSLSEGIPGYRHSAQYSPEPMDIDGDDSNCTIRKDSGVSFDEPITPKKQRAASAEHCGPYHHYSQSPLPLPHRPSLYDTSSIVHPLDIRRPSTAPPSPPCTMRQSAPNTVKLPAISSLTASMPDSAELAPIHRNSRPSFTIYPTEPRTPPQTPCSGGASSSPSPSSSSTGMAPPLAAMRSRRQSSRSAKSGKSPGQFLCEHIVDPATKRKCGQTFRRSYDLSRHQSIHLKNRPFCYCTQCGKKFTRMDALRRHERVQGHSSKRYHTSRHHSAGSLPHTHSMDHAQQARA